MQNTDTGLGVPLRTVADAVASAVTANGGATFHALTGIVPLTGVAVGGTFGWILPGGPFRHATLSRLVEAFARTTSEALCDPTTYLGAWSDPADGTLYLDVVRRLDTRAEALRVARDAGEKAVFDLATGETFYVEGGDNGDA